MHGGLVEPLAVFDSTGDGTWAVDMDLRIVYCNKAAEQLFSIPAEEALGQHCWQLLAGRDLQDKPLCSPQCRVLARVRQGETVPSFDMLCRAHDGRQLLINVSTLFVSPETEAGNPAQEFLVHLFRLVGEANGQPYGLRIRLLGPTTVARSEGSIVDGRLWRRAKVRGLLAMLASHPGHWLSRRLLVNTFWANMPHASACHNLNTAIYNLRHCLEPELKKGADSSYIRYEQDHYLLDHSDAHWLDVEAFEAGIHDARSEDDPELAIPLYCGAQAHYRGEFQADLEPDWSWHRSERMRLQRVYLASLEELARRHEQLHHREEAAAVYRRILGLDPCHELASRGLMRWSMKRGDRPSALSHYHDLLDNLQRELDISPSQKTRLLYESIRYMA